MGKGWVGVAGLLLGWLFALAPTGAQDEPAAPKTVRVPELGVAFELPATWREAASENSWFPFPTPAIMASLWVEGQALPEGSEATVEELAALRKPKGMPKGFETFEVLVDEARTRSDGLRYVIRDAKGTMTIERTYRFRHVFVLHGGKLITITAQIEDSAWKEHVAALDRAVETLRFGKEDPAAARRIDVPEARLSVHLPDGWRKSPAVGEGVVATLWSPEQEYLVTVRVEEREGAKVKKLLDRLKTKAEERRGIRVLKKGAREREDGVAFYLMDYKVKVVAYPKKTKESRRGRKLGLLHGEKLIVVEAEVLSSKWKDVSKELDAFVETLELHPAEQ